jgi:UPF0755 protein
MSRIITRIFSFCACLLGTALLFALFLAGAFMYLNTAPQDSPALYTGDGVHVEADGTAYLEVRKGESAQSVGMRLEQAGLIRSRHLWRLLCRFDGQFIKTGSYRLETPASLLKVHAILVSGRQLLRRVTIPEGLTLKKIAKILEDAQICTAEDFLAAAADPQIIKRFGIPGSSMEGYLFPDTYLFPADYPATELVKAMADNFFSRMLEIDPKVLEMGPDALNRTVILASIVEREYRVNDEAPLMAGVFYNRLEIGMALQSCATVEYIITEIQNRPHPEVLSTKDTEIRDPYNTYMRPGLPPGPISAPGAVALKAVLHPANSDFLYFRLVDPASGRHYFSKTLDDHIRAGLLYVKGRY